MHNMWLWNCTHLRGLLKESLTHGACSTYKHFSHWWHRLNMPPSPQLSHSFRNAVKMSLKHFVLTIENRQLHARVQRNISHSVNGTTGSYGGGWRNVEFKYGWCHCIKPVSANQLCAWKEWETRRYNRHVYAQVFQNPPALIFSEGWVLKKRLLCLGLLIIPIIPLSLHRYIPLENDLLFNPLFLLFFSCWNDLQYWSAAYTVLWHTLVSLSGFLN